MEIVELVRGNLSGLARKTLGALVTLDVHARDIITKLKNNRVSNLDEFDWIA